jgi:phosphate transport system substrate-binding protein
MLAKLILYLGIAPFLLSMLSLFFVGAWPGYAFLLQLIVLAAGGLLIGTVKSRKVNEKDWLLACGPLVYTAAVWAVFMIVSGGFAGHESWLFYGILHIPFAPIFIFSSLMGEGRTFLWAPLAFEMAFLVPIAVSMIKRKNAIRMIPRKKAIILSLVFALSIGGGAFIHWERSRTVLPSYGFDYGGGYSSTDLTPYDITNTNNRLPKLEGGADFSISDADTMPVLDGAEAAFPVYSAFANAVYKNVREVSLEKEVVSFTNTIYAYERLLSGDADIYFGAEPSAEQRKMAEDAGKELVMTPIGKEAFVFFANPENSIKSLTVEQVKDIYSGKIKNWSEVGGSSGKIIAFQRPKNSGSQTLLEKIMGDTPIMEPLKEEVPEGMGGIIEQVADYRNYDNSIGFSFRFFATGMNGSTDIRLLAIDGADPSPENIASGKYPFTASLYAITLKSNPNKNITPFLEWMQGEQGQQIVEEIGYIKGFES